MAVITLTGTPPERADDRAWTQARIEESATESGSYAEVETVTLTPVDTDPSNPVRRAVTTEQATAGYWQRLVWIDTDGDQSDPTDPIEDRGTLQAFATRAELARLLKVSATTFADQLDEVLLAAAGEIVAEIGREDLSAWEQSLAAQVNLERAAEHWHQRAVAFGIIGLDAEGPVRLARDTWDRHAHKLAPLKTAWGLA